MNSISRRQFTQATALFSLALMGLPGGITLAQEPARRQPNVLFVLTDQWRASAMGYVGNPNVQTPNLDKLQKQSIYFRNAVSVYPICTPARAALLTGEFPTTTGMIHNDIPLPDSALCMGDMFKSAGYDTGYIGKWHVDGHGRDAFIPPERRRGFDYWKVAECDHNYFHSHYYTGNDPTKHYWEGYDAYAQTRDAEQFIRSHARTGAQADGAKPFLLVVSYGGPHFPHEPSPPEFRKLYSPDTIELSPNVPEDQRDLARKESAGYYAHCSAIDKCVGDLLSTLDDCAIARDTIVVFTSDHGEMMGSHDVAPHEKKWPYNESSGIPFLLRYPAGQGNACTVNTPIDTPDVLPTLLGLCQIPIPTCIEGQSLAGLVRNPQDQPDRAALIMSVSHQRMNCPEYRGIRTARYTYVRNLEGPWLLYDNDTDPGQMSNLIGKPEYAALQADLEKRLQTELARIHDELRPRQYYLDRWGLKPSDKGKD